MMTISKILPAAFLFSWTAGAASGQEVPSPAGADEYEEILAKVAEHVHGQFTDAGGIPTDPEVVVVSNVTAGFPDRSDEADPVDDATDHLWSEQDLESAAGAVAARISDLEDVYSCSGTPASCTLVDADLVLAFGEPEMRADTVLVPVTVINRSVRAPDPSTTHRQDTTLKLTRTQDGWTVVGRGAVRVT